jgi:pimeloyl-ACP methyl ester carboxylesterase
VADTLPAEVKLIDLGEHRLRDPSRREHVFQLEAPGLESDFALLRSPDVLPGDDSLEQRIDDVHAVMDAVSSTRAIVFGYSEGAPMAILFAATYPEKVSALMLGSAFARWWPASDYPCGPGAERVHASMVDIGTHRWGQGDTIQWFMPSRANSPRARQALGRFEPMAISPGTFLRMGRLICDIDVRAVLPAIRVPTLVIQRRGDRINPPFYDATSPNTFPAPVTSSSPAIMCCGSPRARSSMRRFSPTAGLRTPQ